MATIPNPSTTFSSPVEVQAGDATLRVTADGFRASNAPKGPDTRNYAPGISNNGLVVPELDIYGPTISLRRLNYSRNGGTAFTNTVTQLPQFGISTDSCQNIHISRIDPKTDNPYTTAFELFRGDITQPVTVVRHTDPTKPGEPSRLLRGDPSGKTSSTESIMKVTDGGDVIINTSERGVGTNAFGSIRAAVFPRSAPVAEFLPNPKDANGKELTFTFATDGAERGSTKVVVGGASATQNGADGIICAWIKRDNELGYSSVTLKVDPARYSDSQALGVHVNDAGKIVIVGEALNYADGKPARVPVIWIENEPGKFEMQQLLNTGTNAKGDKFSVSYVNKIQTGAYTEIKDGKKQVKYVTFLSGEGLYDKDQNPVHVVYQIGGKDVPVATSDLAAMLKESPTFSFRDLRLDTAQNQPRALIYHKEPGNVSSYSDFNLAAAKGFYDTLADITIKNTTPDMIRNSARQALRGTDTETAAPTTRSAIRGWPKGLLDEAAAQKAEAN